MCRLINWDDQAAVPPTEVFSWSPFTCMPNVLSGGIKSLAELKAEINKQKNKAGRAGMQRPELRESVSLGFVRD
jgi:hypothetical protein